jgi:uncharacterized protein (TIGR03437 family)
MKVRKIAADGRVYTVVGRDQTDDGNFSEFCCNGMLATSARVGSGSGLLFDSAGNLYISNDGNDNYVHKVIVEKYSGGERPSIAGVANAADWHTDVAPTAWIAIQGANLAPTIRGWADGDFAGGKLPEQLEGARVYVEGWPIAISYINPIQINGMMHHRWEDEFLNDRAPVEVITPQGRSDPYYVTRKSCSPGLFRWGVDSYKWVIAQIYSPDGAAIYAGRAGLIPGVYTRPARPGDILTLYGTGFGRTEPPTDASLIPDGDYEFYPEACWTEQGSSAWIAIAQ